VTWTETCGSEQGDRGLTLKASLLTTIFLIPVSFSFPFPPFPLPLLLLLLLPFFFNGKSTFLHVIQKYQNLSCPNSISSYPSTSTLASCRCCPV
jgi:hypothetical protein